MGMGSIVSILSQSTWGWWVLSVVWGVRWCECLSLNIICTGIIYSIIHFHLICSEMIHYPRLQAAIALSGSILIINEPIPQVTSWDGFGAHLTFIPHICAFIWINPCTAWFLVLLGLTHAVPWELHHHINAFFVSKGPAFPLSKAW